MTHKQHARARFVPRNDGTDGPWEQGTVEPRVPIAYPIHYWSVWKGLTRMDQHSDTRITWIINETITEWANAFADVRLSWMDSHAHTETQWRLELKEHDSWEVLERSLLDADPRRAFMMVAGMAVEVQRRLEGRDDNERSQIWQDFKDVKLWGVYRWHFGSPENPRMEMYL